MKCLLSPLVCAPLAISNDLAAIPPGGILLECLNASLVALRRQQITEPAYRRLIDFILSLEMDLADPSMIAVSELARKHQQSACEAACLAIAAQKQCSLATLDERLKQAAGAEGLPECYDESRLHINGTWQLIFTTRSKAQCLLM